MQYHSLFLPLNLVSGWLPPFRARRRSEEHFVSACLIPLTDPFRIRRDLFV
ncbi:hypothetical protein AB0958_01375 [Streptomyces sp. NPDC006655]|uniref:hypothetical protein n=1 Tax=unclassified Streptomyces TaxID=2593676 RepID=UPI003456C935